MKRRDFIKASALGATVPASMLVSCSSVNSKIKINKDNPIILSTWAHGLPANVAALKALEKNGNAAAKNL